MPEIKICGIKNIEDINIVNRLVPDYIGFVFADSKRKISPEKAKMLMSKLSNMIKIVGVFLDADIKFVKEVLNQVEIDIIQLHGNEDMKYILKLKEFFNGEIWKSVPVCNNFKGSFINRIPNDITIIFDSKKGGSGESFDWEKIKGISEKRKIVLAGGLNSNNIKMAIDIVKPQVVDVSSGVEKEGRKDPEKTEKFMRSVKNEF
jgi:phosphoribosylanthranilate isomerase